LSLNEIKKKKLEELKETQAQQEQAMEIET
jgi:hypothetical protein